MNYLIAPQYKLPAEAYFEESWLIQEKRKIFGASWLYAGQTSEFHEHGSYKTIKAGLDELVVVRDKHDQLNAFHNVCRHRGAQLVQGTGQCGTLVCPYHKWTYGLDGHLRGVAKHDQFTDIDNMSLGLHPASVETWMGLVFINANEHPTESLTEWLGDIGKELAPFGADKLELLKSNTISFEANWKFYIENHIDWLHLWFVHPETLAALDHDKGQFEQLGRHWVSYEPAKREHAQAYKTSSPLPDIPHVKDAIGRYSENGAHFIFPNLPIFTGTSFFAIAELIPLTAEKTQMKVNLLGVPGGDEDAFFELFNEITKGEDARIIENIQRNVRSKHFAVGPLAHSYEKAISDFHDHYLKLMDL